jgi:acetyl-CoA carboxylase carboxyltransferase component
MGPAGAIKIINRAELAAAADRKAAEQELVEKYKEEIANPFKAEELGMIDDVIKPSDTGGYLSPLLRYWPTTVSQPERKHGNIPL